MNRALLTLLASLVFTACTADQATDKEPIDACVPNPGKVSLPADDAVHDELVEWWYWTGHLKDTSQREYGFQVTFFAFGAGEARALLANVAVTDLSAGSYHRGAKFQFGVPERIDGGFQFELGPHQATGGGGNDQLVAEAGDYTLELRLESDAPAVRQHGDGYHTYAFGGDTYYYSRPRMAASGTLTVDGEQREVEGTGWFDHQWGDLEAATDAGWDWFALNLEDGRDVMLFLVHGADGDTLVGGSISQSNLSCEAPQVLEAVEVTPTGTWESPESGCIYPQGWQLKIGELTLDLATRVPDQEMYNSRDNSKTYWEGAVDVTGDATGRGYVELAGYCEE